MAQLKKQLAEARAKKGGTASGEASTSEADPEAAAVPANPMEWDRVLTQEDFERIRKLKVRTNLRVFTSTWLLSRTGLSFTLAY